MSESIEPENLQSNLRRLRLLHQCRPNALKHARSPTNGRQRRLREVLRLFQKRPLVLQLTSRSVQRDRNQEDNDNVDEQAPSTSKLQELE